MIAFNRAFAALLAVSLLFQLAIIWSQREYFAAGYFDFVLYYAGAQILRDGRQQELFNLDVQRAYQKNFGVAQLHLDVPFNHAPYELLIFLPLSYLSYPVAHLVWSLFNALLLMFMLYRLRLFVDSKNIFLYALMVFAYFPAMMALKMGQDSVLSTLLLVEAFINLKRAQNVRAGVLLALGLYKPQLVLPMVGLLLLKRCWSVVAGFIPTAILLAVISLAIVGWGGALQLLSLWQTMIERGHFIWPELMTNVRGLLYFILNASGVSSATNLISFVVSIALYLYTAVLWRGAFTRDGVTFDLKFALGIVTTVLISFHLYSYDALILILALILTFHHVLENRFEVRLAGRLVLLVLIALYIPFLPNLLLSRFLLALATVPLLLLYLALAIEIRKRTDRS